jgi:predicted GNAT family N-acyltransferase
MFPTGQLSLMMRIELAYLSLLQWKELHLVLSLRCEKMMQQQRCWAVSIDPTRMMEELVSD